MLLARPWSRSRSCPYLPCADGSNPSVALVNERDHNAAPAVGLTERHVRPSSVLAVAPYVWVTGQDLLHLCNRDPMPGEVLLVAVISISVMSTLDPPSCMTIAPKFVLQP